MDSKTFLKEFDRVTHRLQEKHPINYNFERALYLLLKGHENDIRIDSAFKFDPTGLKFHKNFRQVDITSSPELDSAIWLLIGQSKAFWDTINRLSNIDSKKA